MSRGTRLLIGSILIMPPLAAADDAQEIKETYVKVACRGTLSSPVFAIGGETTGTVINVNGVTLELDLTEQSNLAEVAEALDGRSVAVTGSLTFEKGVEIPERQIVQVSSLKPVEEDLKPQRIQVTLKGMLHQNVIQAEGLPWKLTFDSLEDLSELATTLDGQSVVVTGELVIPKNEKALKDRIVKVSSLKATDEP